MNKKITSLKNVLSLLCATLKVRCGWLDFFSCTRMDRTDLILTILQNSVAKLGEISYANFIATTFSRHKIAASVKTRARDFVHEMAAVLPAIWLPSRAQSLVNKKKLFHFWYFFFQMYFLHRNITILNSNHN